MFGLKFQGEANLSVVMLKPSLNACVYLSGVVHWFASLLFLLPLDSGKLASFRPKHFVPTQLYMCTSL